MKLQLVPLSAFVSLYVCTNMCQIWSQSDGRIEKRAGGPFFQCDRRTATKFGTYSYRCGNDSNLKKLAPHIARKAGLIGPFSEVGTQAA